MISVYIDESGNLGKDGKFFIFGAIIFKTTAARKRISKLIHRQQILISERHNHPITEIKSNFLNFEERQFLLNQLVKQTDYDIFYLVAKKSCLTLLQRQNVKDRTNLAYNYLAGILVSNIALKYQDDLHIIFDQRSTKIVSKNSLKDYIRIKLFSVLNFQHNVKIEQRDSKLENNLQAADIISGTVFRAYEKGHTHHLNLLHRNIAGRILFPQSKF